MSNHQIRVGIAGLGRSGWNIHAKLLEPLADHYQIVAVADADEARQQEASERFGCEMYDDYDSLLADDNVELVVMALPNFLHAGLSLQALSAGKHVVCEKPMATSLADADRMVKAASQSNCVLAPFHNRRYNPDFQKIQAIIASGMLGRVVLINITESKFSRRWDWQTLKRFGGGTLNNNAAHHLDMGLQLFGDGYPEEVFASLDTALTLGDADDHVKLVFAGEGHPTVDIELSSARAFPVETWNIAGTRGGLSGSTKELRWKWIDMDKQLPRTLTTEPMPDRSYNRDDLAWEEDSWRVEDDDGPGYAGFYLDLYETIRNGAPQVITPESARRVIWLQERAHELSPV